MGIYLTQIIHAQYLHPVAVGLLINTSLLQQNLLHLLQIVGIRSSNRLLHTLEEARNSCIYLIWVQLSRTVDGKCQLAVVIENQAARCTSAVSSTQLLTDAAQILHLQQTGRNISQYGCLLSISRQLHKPHLACLALWILHCLGKDVLHLALSVWNLLVLQLHALVWQRSDILLDERQEYLLVVVTYKVEGEVLGIAIELLLHVEHTVVVDVLDILYIWKKSQLVAQVESALDRILIYHVRVVALVREHGNVGILQVLECLLVLGQVGHREIEQLHHGFQILRSSATADTVTERTHGETYAALLTSQHLLQVVACETSQSAYFPYGRSIGSVNRVVLECRVTHVGTSGNTNLIILIVGLLQYHLGTVREGELLEAEHLVLYHLLDAASLRS